jgi:ankyrin repeat protein
MRLPLAVLGFALALGACGWSGETPLAAAARNGDVGALALLLDHGSDVNERSGMNGWTVLMHAVDKHQHATARALLDAGADPNLASGESTALLMAAGYGDEEMVGLLLDAGADAQYQTADGFNALAAALLGSLDVDEPGVGGCRTETVRVLVERAPALALSTSFNGQFPAAYARAAGCDEALRLAGAARAAGT